MTEILWTEVTTFILRMVAWLAVIRSVFYICDRHILLFMYAPQRDCANEQKSRTEERSLRGLDECPSLGGTSKATSGFLSCCFVVVVFGGGWTLTSYRPHRVQKALPYQFDTQVIKS